jgi:BirA family biotin operon repressor/biotin-[acetyl-CoA-carboxylase] ligase
MPLDVDRIRTRLPEREVVWFDTIGSTMIEAARLASKDCPSGTVVLADEQAAGQGRYGRTWHSEKESGLYVSVVLRLPLPPESMPVLMLALGMATQDAIARSTDLACDLRWPNDVLADGRKCAGILVQLLETAIIAGVGINVNQVGFPDELSGTATSLRIVSGRRHSREDLLVQLLEAIDGFCSILLDGGKEQILRLYSHASSFTKGRRVIIEQGDSVLEGTTEGLDPSGFLILRRTDGRRNLILTGGVRPA